MVSAQSCQVVAGPVSTLAETAAGSSGLDGLGLCVLYAGNRLFIKSSNW